MKKWNVLLSMTLMAGALFVTSCSKDETTDPGPSLNLKGGSGYTSDDKTIAAGDSIRVGVIAASSNVSNDKLTNFKFTVTFDNSSATVDDAPLNSTTYDMDYVLTFSAGSVGENRLKLEVTDKGGKTVSKEFVITVTPAPVAVSKYTDVTLGSFNDAIGSFYSTSDSSVYTRGQAAGDVAIQAKIDFIFFKGTTVTNVNSLAAPSDPAPNSITDLQMSGWTVRNATLLTKVAMTPAEFKAIGNTYTFPDFTATTTIANQLATNDVVFFKTVDGRSGLVLVVDLFTRGDEGKFDVIVSQ